MRYLSGLVVAAVLATATGGAAQPASDAHKRALARELMDTMHFEKMMDTITSAMQQGMQTTFSAEMSKSDQAKLDAISAASTEEMRAFMPKMQAYMVDVYASELTEKELSDTVAFYKTDSGQSILAKMPALSQRMMPFVQQQMPAMIGGMFKRYCVKVTCTKEEKSQVEKLTGAR